MAAQSSLISDFPARWLLYWIIVPNLTIILMWFVGGPPMVAGLTIFSLSTLVLAQLPWVWVKRVGLGGLIGYVSFLYVCNFFNFDAGEYDFLLPFLREVKPFRSLEYLMAGAVFLASAGFAIWKAPQVQRFASPLSYGLAILSIMGVLAADYVSTKSTRGSYRSNAPAGAPFASAVDQAGIMSPDGQSHHLVVVIVEAMGVPTGKVGKALFAEDWNRPDWASRYNVSRGEVPFYGSTTSGELRELCGLWSDYGSVDQFGADCLPARYARAGYQTSAMHGFSETFFNREAWYPSIGFARMEFRESLAAAGVDYCNGVFTGTCDRQVPALIGERLKQASAPQMVYFLTLNTHLPIVSTQRLGTADCDLGPAGWAEENPQLCKLFILHRQLADAIDRLAMDPDLPATDFLIVGDHLPPFFDRKDRASFAPDRVPWVFLKAQGQ